MDKPNLTPREMKLNVGYVNKLLGVELKKEKVKELLERMRFGVDDMSDDIVVSIPAYRTDILHPIDLVEDVAIAYGYMKFTPREDDIKVRGGLKPETVFENKIRGIMNGLGFAESMTLVMTNKRDLFERMQKKQEAVVESESAVSSEHSVARNWLLPSMMKVLEVNKNHEYPQRFFEVGLCLNEDGRNLQKISGVVAHARTNFSEMKSIVLGVYESIGVEHTAKAGKHPSFMEGRCAQTPHGIYGEIHPQVLENFSLEVPVTAFELDVESLYKSR